MSKYTTHELQQGSPEWLAYRANTLNASDAGTALGINSYKTRQELVRELATGLTKEIDAGTQRRFDDGHRFERLAMPLAEAIIGEPLSATTVSCAVPGLKRRLSASLDGATFGDTENAEHKTLSESLAAAMDRGEIPEQYPPQMEQGMMVTGATRCLFIASKWDANDQLIDEKHIWYESNPELRAKIIAAWKQVEADVDAYVPSDIKEMPKAAVVVDLPALFVHAKGEITTHNMDEFGKALAIRLAETRAIVLVTDQDFSNAKAAATKFRETAKAIALSKAQMLAQTETIGAAAIKMDAWAADLNATALQLEKDVKREDLAKKEVMVLTAKGKYTDHIASLEAETKPIRLALVAPNFAEAIKGKSKYTSMQDAVDTMLAGAVIAADQSAKDVREKLAWCKDNAAGYSALFPDLQQIIVKPMEDFALTITSRIDKAKADEAKKLEAIKEAARVEAEANAAAKVKAEQEAEDALIAGFWANARRTSEGDTEGHKGGGGNRGARGGKERRTSSRWPRQRPIRKRPRPSAWPVSRRPRRSSTTDALSNRARCCRKRAWPMPKQSRLSTPSAPPNPQPRRRLVHPVPGLTKRRRPIHVRYSDPRRRRAHQAGRDQRPAWLHGNSRLHCLARVPAGRDDQGREAVPRISFQAHCGGADRPPRNGAAEGLEDCCMKIIAGIDSSRFLVEVHDNEIAKIAGFTYPSEIKMGIKVGQEIKVADLWRALEISRERHDELAKMATQLRTAATRVDSINAALSNPIVEVKTA